MFFSIAFFTEREEGATLSIQCTADNPCVTMQLLTQRTMSQDERLDKMEALIEALRNRLPLWATVTMTAGGTVIGVLAGHVKF